MIIALHDSFTLVVVQQVRMLPAGDIEAAAGAAGRTLFHCRHLAELSDRARFPPMVNRTSRAKGGKTSGKRKKKIRKKTLRHLNRRV